MYTCDYTSYTLNNILYNVLMGGEGRRKRIKIKNLHIAVCSLHSLFKDFEGHLTRLKIKHWCFSCAIIVIRMF